MKTVVIQQHEQLAAQMKAMAHPARVQILQTLSERRQCVCGEIVEVVGLAQSTVSQHLKVLKEAGFIQGEIQGPKSCYCLNQDALRAFQQATQAFVSKLVAPENTTDCC